MGSGVRVCVCVHKVIPDSGECMQNICAPKSSKAPAAQVGILESREQYLLSWASVTHARHAARRSFCCISVSKKLQLLCANWHWQAPGWEIKGVWHCGWPATLLPINLNDIHKQAAS